MYMFDTSTLTDSHTSGQVAIFFQHACKNELANLTQSESTKLRNMYETSGAEGCRFWSFTTPLPALEFSDLCKCAMVNKEWNSAVKGALSLLNTLYFSFIPCR
jgi:hypothetical protein